MIRADRFGKWLFCAVILLTGTTRAQEPLTNSGTAEVHLHLVGPAGKERHVPAVIWLEPLAGTPALPFPAQPHYTLLQKNRMFTPHLQVVPAGSVVDFPNADPFFHNVFSLFDGKRFDLGLYEAGSSKSVTFSREGVSYIFCNIHPEMSAVVIALSTPLYAIADRANTFAVHNVPPGDYKLHIWIEGMPQSTLNGFERRVHVAGRAVDLGEVKAPLSAVRSGAHTNKFGDSYPPEVKSPY